MSRLVINAEFPLVYEHFDSIFIDTIKKSIEIFVSVKFPQYKDVELNFEVVYGTQKSEIIINTFPVDYIVNAEVWSFVMTASVNLTTPIWKGKNFVFSGILYMPEQWNIETMFKFYDLFIERITYSFPNMEINDIRVVYVKEIRGNILIPIIQNPHNELQKIIIHSLERIAFSVYNEIDNKNNMQRIASDRDVT